MKAFRTPPRCSTRRDLRVHQLRVDPRRRGAAAGRRGVRGRLEHGEAQRGGRAHLEHGAHVQQRAGFTAKDDNLPPRLAQRPAEDRPGQRAWSTSRQDAAALLSRCADGRPGANRPRRRGRPGPVQLRPPAPQAPPLDCPAERRQPHSRRGWRRSRSGPIRRAPACAFGPDHPDYLRSPAAACLPPPRCFNQRMLQ